jgi:hypothetical protein
MATNGDPVTVTAEWALWGKDAGDAGYHLLECSAGTVSRENFDEVLTRYSPGTLEELPQTTISWLSDRAQPSYVGMAIHDAAERVQYDVSGREIVLTSYFCVPFNELAVGSVPYHAMYQKFRQYALPVPDRHRIQVRLEGLERDEPADVFAMQVAALLLTSKPVCIIGADRAGISVDERLRFLDRVVSLLPYGMRSRLSASTWASSTFRDHRLRLFFANARRPGDDHVVVWDQPPAEAINNSYAYDYLCWVSNDVPGRAARLATLTQEMGFSQPDVLRMLELLGIKRGRPTRTAHTQDLVRWEPATPAIISVEDLLTSCAEQLRDGAPAMRPLIGMLREHLQNPTTESCRAQYRTLISRHRLLRDDLPVDKRLRQDLYEVLLKLAFKTPLNYAAYCQVESCVYGQGGQHGLHESLLRAIAAVGLDGLIMRLLVLAAVDKRMLKSSLRKYPPAPEDLLQAAADGRLYRSHGRIIFTVATGHLLELATAQDRVSLRPILNHYGYLAAALSRLYPENPEHQVSWLSRLLRMAHGKELDTLSVRYVLQGASAAPTDALFAAILLMVHRKNTRFVEREYIRHRIMRTRFSSETHEDLLHRLPEYIITETDPEEQKASDRKADPPPKRRSRWPHPIRHQ